MAAWMRIWSSTFSYILRLTSQNLRFEANAGFGISEAGIFWIILSASVWNEKTVRIYLCKAPPCLPVPWKLNSLSSTSPNREAAIRLCGEQNQEHWYTGGSRIPRRSGRAQWYSRNSRPGHNEGGEMKFLWTCSLQTEVMSILFLNIPSKLWQKYKL